MVGASANSSSGGLTQGESYGAARAAPSGVVCSGRHTDAGRRLSVLGPLPRESFARARGFVDQVRLLEPCCSGHVLLLGAVCSGRALQRLPSLFRAARASCSFEGPSARAVELVGLTQPCALSE